MVINMKKLIGQSMVDANLINETQLTGLLEYQSKARERILLGRLSVDLGLVTDDEFAPFIASYFDVPFVNLKNFPPPSKDISQLVPESIARRFNVAPLIIQNNTLTVAVSDPMDLPTIENIETITHCHVKTVVSTPTQIRYTIAVTYGIL